MCDMDDGRTTARPSLLYGKIFSHRAGTGLNPAHVEPTPIPIIKSALNGESYKYFVKIKFCRCPTYSTSDLYDFKMYLFYHGKPADFLLFSLNFNMNIAETWTLEIDAKIQYLSTLIHGESLRQFDLLLLT